MGIKIADKLRKLLGREKKTSDSIIRNLRNSGAVIGEDVHIYFPSRVVIDETAPYLIEIGSHVQITGGVIILTHDYAWSALKTYQSERIMPGAILGAQGPVKIGNHVFIGMNSIILRGVTIGDHVIIAAGSVVNRNCESNSIYAGNPAQRICSIEEYYEKRKASQFSEAKALAECYIKRFNKKPPMEVFGEYFMLFMTRQEAECVNVFKEKMQLLSNYHETEAYMDAVPPMFNGYDEFLEACGIK